MPPTAELDTVPSAQEQAIRDTLTKLLVEIDAAASTLDVDRFMARFLRDSALVYVLLGDMVVGWQATAAAQRRMWSQLESAAFQSGEPHFIVLSPDAAILTSLGTFTVKGRGGGVKTGEFARTLAWRRTFEGWRVVQAHESARFFDPYRQGIVYERDRRYELAVAEFTKAIALNPRQPAPLSERALAYIDLGEYERAIEDVDEAIRLDPEYWRAYNNRGIAYKAQKKYELALADFRRTAELAPNYDDAHINQAFVYVEMEQYEKAIEIYDRLVRHAAKPWVSYNNRGNVYARLWQYERAIEDFDKAIELNGRFPAAYVGRAKARHELGDLEGASEDWRRACELGFRAACDYVENEL